MRSIWNGAISFGLVTIPVRLYGAVEEKSIRFHQLHSEDSGRIRYKRTCSSCGKDVALDEIVKGYEYEKDRYVVFSSEELARLPAESIRAIDVVTFVPLADIDPVYFSHSYYVAPEPTGIKAYRLLEKALKEKGRVGIAKVTLREKEYLAVLRLKEGVFVLETMYWPDEIRTPDLEELEKKVEVREPELEMAKTLIDSMSGDFEPGRFSDAYRKKLEEAAQAKIEGQEIAVAPEAPQPTAVADLMAALKASVERAVKAREEGESQEAEPATAKSA